MTTIYKRDLFRFLAKANVRRAEPGLAGEIVLFFVDGEERRSREGKLFEDPSGEFLTLRFTATGAIVEITFEFADICTGEFASDARYVTWKEIENGLRAQQHKTEGLRVLFTSEDVLASTHREAYSTPDGQVDVVLYLSDESRVCAMEISPSSCH